VRETFAVLNVAEEQTYGAKSATEHNELIFNHSFYFREMLFTPENKRNEIE
jgi:hypothetical protein